MHAGGARSKFKRARPKQRKTNHGKTNSLIKQRWLQRFDLVACAVKRREPVPLNRRDVCARTIAFVLREAVLRVALRELIHRAVVRDLGEDARRAYFGDLCVGLYERLKPAYAVGCVAVVDDLSAKTRKIRENLLKRRS